MQLNKQIAWSVCTLTNFDYWTQDPGCLFRAEGRFFLNIPKSPIKPSSKEIVVVLGFCYVSWVSVISLAVAAEGWPQRKALRAGLRSSSLLVWGTLRLFWWMAVSCQTIISSTVLWFTKFQCQEGSFHLHRDNQPSVRCWGRRHSSSAFSQAPEENWNALVFHHGCYYFS